MKDKFIVLHFPFSLELNKNSASGIRPRKMLEAFRSLGYKVSLIHGSSSARKRKIKVIEKLMRKGRVYDFVYSESSTMPTALTDLNHLPRHPILDFGFFKFCKKRNVKVLLFYRDIHWLFDHYKNNTSFLKQLVTSFFYRFDLFFYNRLVHKIYLPSKEMGKYLPKKSFDFLELPPGHGYYQNPCNRKFKDADSSSSDRKLELIYVGGLSDLYDLRLLSELVVASEGMRLTLCTRKEEWAKAKADYPRPCDNFIVKHPSKDEVLNEYQGKDVAVLFVKPTEYWTFAQPMKLYEYIGVRLPILVSDGTLAASIVSKLDIGWVAEYSKDALQAINMIIAEQLNGKRRNLEKEALQHTWNARAMQVVEDAKVD